MTVCAQDHVAQLEARIAERLGPQRFNVWFKNATRFTLTEDYLHIASPNHFVGEWIERHFADVVAHSTTSLIQPPPSTSSPR